MGWHTGEMYPLVCQNIDKKADIYVHQSSTGVNRQPRRVPKQQDTSQQVNRQRRNSGSLASSSIASSQRPGSKIFPPKFSRFFFQKFSKNFFLESFFKFLFWEKFYREKKNQNQRKSKLWWKWNCGGMVDPVDVAKEILWLDIVCEDK